MGRPRANKTNKDMSALLDHLLLQALANPAVPLACEIGEKKAHQSMDLCPLGLWENPASIGTEIEDEEDGKDSSASAPSFMTKELWIFNKQACALMACSPAEAERELFAKGCVWYLYMILHSNQ